jgi:GT2 family glycosyltransferase
MLWQGIAEERSRLTPFRGAVGFVYHSKITGIKPQITQSTLCNIHQNKFYLPCLKYTSVLLLSIVIVSYNACNFLEQCLFSVRKATAQLQCEVIVVDNASHDDTVNMIKTRFPEIRLIANNDNPGFAKANNQATLKASGKYILFLNPDTIIPEDCLPECIRFMESNPLAGACGLRMIDGRGQYLPESKRGHPTPWASFTKITGLSTLFGSSRIFAGYYLGHLDARQVQVVDALAGAFMMVSRQVFDLTGGFDERFFMYAEDIDLSYRIRQLDYNNYYLPSPAIIHFKGESTEKDEQYVSRFHRAMEQFVEKHRENGSVFINTLIKKGIALKTQIEKIRFLPADNSNDNENKFPTAVAMVGDQNICNSISQRLSEKGIKILEESDATAATHFLLCEGPLFPFSSIINFVDEHPAGKYWFHAAGSSAVISSFHSKKRGAAIPL